MVENENSMRCLLAQVAFCVTNDGARDCGAGASRRTLVS